jgi:hypothetical protein
MIDFFPLKKGNRMVRAGLGQHDSKWFIRIDFWFGALRLKRK